MLEHQKDQMHVEETLGVYGQKTIHQFYTPQMVGVSYTREHDS